MLAAEERAQAAEELAARADPLEEERRGLEEELRRAQKCADDAEAALAALKGQQPPQAE